MFLKTLTLKGFKSFAEPTTIEFEPGVTVVVGPNGSGKSNVVDAVAWVLGAQGPKTVRSSRMDDVIFAGSSSRPALGRAEVSLVIDNRAGRLGIGLSEVTITRTLFRSGESEYAINGAACRLLDVQELLSDSGVGRQQHVIVGQGQLDGVLSARPEDRRLMIEEAAGVLKYRRRREKAERRLEATEGNLLRLQDLLREVRRQLRPLERQADAARRHSGLEAELRSVRLYLAGRDLESLARRREASRGARQALAEEESVARRHLADLDSSVLAAEHALDHLRSAEQSELVGRLGRLSERARGLGAVLAERRRSVEEARRAVVDEQVVASLEAEERDLAGELESVDGARVVLQGEEAALDEADAALEVDRRALEDGFAGPDGSLDAGRDEEAVSAARVRARVAALRHGLDRDHAENTRLATHADVLAGRETRLRSELDELHHELEQGTRPLQRLRAELDQVTDALAAANGAAERADDEARRREHRRHRQEARAEALAFALDDDRPLEPAWTREIEGALGILGDLVEVDTGYERAFEAAMQDAMRAVIVEDLTAARELLDRLRQSGSVRGVLVAPPGRASPTPAGGEVRPPTGGTPLRRLVTARDDAVAALLDELIGGVVALDDGWEAALEAHLGHPELVVVTADGARFGRGGWHSLGRASEARRVELERAVADARSAGDEAEAAAGAATTAREACAAEAERLARATRELEGRQAEAAAAKAALGRVEAGTADAAAELESARDQLASIRARMADDSASLEELEEVLPRLESEEAERLAANRASRARLDERLRDVSRQRSKLSGRAAGLDARRALLSRRLGEIARRLEGNRSVEGGAATRQVRLGAAAAAIERLAALVGRHLVWLEGSLDRAEGESRRRADELGSRSRRLEELRSGRGQTERQLAEIRERIQRAEIDDAESRLREEAAREAVRRDLDAEPEAALAAAPPDLPEGVSAARRARELEQELRAMGPVNPLALEELAGLVDRHDLLESQLEDVRAARRELAKLIRAIDAEIVDVFASAYSDVADHFSALFATLFPGGGGQLMLGDPSNLLETGVEIEARPAGRNIRKLSLLSGGERSLVALAFLFAIFRSRPSPFYLMDEVEAALDDVNLHRFLDLVHEFRDEAQLIVVSHQKRTMEAADALVGVTMQAGGTSRIVSERVTPEAQPA